MLKEYWIMRNKENHEECFEGRSGDEMEILTGEHPILFSTKHCAEECFENEVSGFDDGMVSVYFDPATTTLESYTISEKEIVAKFEAVKVELKEVAV